MNTTPSLDQIASEFHCTPEQVRAQFRKNAAQLRSMAARARTIGRKVNGYTAHELETLAFNAESQANG